MEGITVRAVRGRKDQSRFIRFPWSIYKGNIYWVPPLIADRKKLLDRARNPFFQHAEMELFLAERNREIVGRIGATLDSRHNAFHKDNVGFFGFFESVNDQAVANALLDASRAWLRSKGAQGMRGPISPSMNDECGLLIDGFEQSPAILMPYNPPYYRPLLEAYGLQKVMDLHAYGLSAEQMEESKVFRLAEMIRKRESVLIRTIDMKNFRHEVELVKKIYNEAWSQNWGFVPLTDDEIDFFADDLRHTVDPDFALFAEVNGETVGFALALPDFNIILKRIPSGRLFPFGIFKLLLYRSKIDSLRIIIAGVTKQYQKRGIDALFYTELFHRGASKGIYKAEAGWVLETNAMMNRGLEALKAVRTKTYRLYEMNLS